MKHESFFKNYWTILVMMFILAFITYGLGVYNAYEFYNPRIKSVLQASDNCFAKYNQSIFYVAHVENESGKFYFGGCLEEDAFEEYIKPRSDFIVKV